MKITEQGRATFAAHLEQSDYLAAPMRMPPRPAPSGVPGMPDDAIEGLAVFEGALAWETGEAREAVPPARSPWAEAAWLSGWDWADLEYGEHQ